MAVDFRIGITQHRTRNGAIPFSRPTAAAAGRLPFLLPMHLPSIAPGKRFTLPRADKWLAQTPQMFRLGLLQRALAQAGAAATDEASAVEALGLQPLLVTGDAQNFKLTWPADFTLAERLLETRR